MRVRSGTSSALPVHDPFCTYAMILHLEYVPRKVIFFLVSSLSAREGKNC